MRAPEGERPKRRERVVDDLRRRAPLLVALSGGVDSAVLLALAVEAAGRASVMAATGESPSLARADLAAAKEVAAALGVDHRVVRTREMDNQAYRANRGDRCFHCRMELFRVLESLAATRGSATLAYGAIRDDLGDDRPGMEAARLRGVIAPLLDAGAGKSDVRAWARDLGLPVAERPAAACLASRIPVGTEVTDSGLRSVELAESALRELGFEQFRVRHHGEVARLELDAPGGRLIADPQVRAEAVAAVRQAGFLRMVVDPAGYRGALLAAGTGPNRESGQ